jgi:hypothetical protein
MARKLALLGAAIVAAAALAAPAAPQPGHQAGNSLVNVQIGDVTLLLPVSVAANVCDLDVNVLAQQLDAADTSCTATAESIASPGNGTGTGSGHTAGDSLVNVQVGDITVLLPIAVAANVCDVAVNVLARQLQTGGATCEADATSEA